MRVKKNLEYFLKLKFDVILRQIDDEDGTFFQATIQELDSRAFYGSGNTPQEALDSLNETKAGLFAYYLENGYPIPEPAPIEEQPSGRFVLRVSPSLHSRLISLARKQGQSLNGYVSSILDQYATAQDIVAAVAQEISQMRLPEVQSIWPKTAWEGVEGESGAGKTHDDEITPNQHRIAV